MSVFKPDISEVDLNRMLSLGEGPNIDFKRAHIPCDSKSDEVRSRLIKDILAFANTQRTGSAYILYGISNDRKIVGISEPWDDASYQTLIRDKANRTPNFQYYTVALGTGERIGVIEIAASQPRPVYLRQNYGEVNGCVIYVRQGSANTPLEPDQWLRLHGNSLTSSAPFPESGRCDVRDLAKRWLYLFEVHNVKHSQIPSLLPNHYIPLSNLTDWKLASSLLNESLLADTCKIFNVQKSWLDGDSKYIYKHVPLSIDVNNLLNILKSWLIECEEVSIMGFRVNKKPLEIYPCQDCAFMLRGTIREFGEKPIFRYQPLYSIFPWDYDKARMITKVAWLAAEIAGCDFWGWHVDTKILQELNNHCSFPDTLLRDPWGKDWHPDDFIYSVEESGMSKESHEFLLVQKVAKDNGVIERACAIRRSISKQSED